MVNDMIAEYENAEQVRFPNKPNPVLPSTGKIGGLVGSYKNAGHGVLDFEEKPHPDNKDEVILVANLDSLLFRHRVELHHVSGDFWLAYLRFPGSVAISTQYFAAHFTVGVDGKGETLVIEYDDKWADLGDGPITYTRTE